MSVYLDSDIVIYLVEQPAGFGRLASARVSELVAAGERLVVSGMTRLECRTGPIGTGDFATLSQYDAFFGEVVGQVVPLSTAVCDRAAAIRARYRFKTPDAVHLAAAIEAGCGMFLTNDSRLGAFPDIKVEVLA